MGLLQSRQQLLEDRKMETIVSFVWYASAGDIINLQLMLKKRKINPNIQDRFGMTALQWACYTGKLACAEALIQAGASSTITDLNGRNALHHASRRNQDHMVQYLVTELNMDINSSSNNKDTPLHKAVKGKSIETVKLLLQLGADPNRRNDQNHTPLDVLETLAENDKGEPTRRLQLMRSYDYINRWQKESVAQDKEISKKLELSPSKKQRFSFRYAVRSSVAANTLATDDGNKDKELYNTDQTLENKTTDEQTKSSASNSLTADQKASPQTRPNAIDPPSTLQLQPHVQKNLKYAAKRVIMIQRIQKYLSGEEKAQVIRLLLEKYSSKDNQMKEGVPEMSN